MTATVSSMPPRVVRRAPAGIALAALLLFAAIIASLAIGPVTIAPERVFSILFDAVFTGRRGEGILLRDTIVVLDVRLPRMMLGLFVGSSLAVAGAVLQGMFRNPLADPIFVGISPGAAFAAVAWIVLGGTISMMLPESVSRFGLSFAAFSGALITTFTLQQVASSNGRTAVATLLFCGIALGALAQAGTGLLIFLASDQQLREFTFWTLGSLGGATWGKVGLIAPWCIGFFLLAATLARGLDALALGEAEAFHTGIDVERLKKIGIIAVAAGVGAAVAVAGVVGFVGLVVPHLLRLMIGPSHKSLLIGSALLGAALLVGADVIARTIVTPAELPLGVVTAFIGAPFFLWLLRRHRAALGG